MSSKEVNLGHPGQVTYLGSRAPFQERVHADMEFVCEDGKLPCHRFVVVAQSRYLWRLMLHRDEDYTAIILPGVLKETMSLIVRFLYTGDLYVHQDELAMVRNLMEEILQLDTKINFPDRFPSERENEVDTDVEEDVDNVEQNDDGSYGGGNTDEDCHNEVENEDEAAIGRRITRAMRGRVNSSRSRSGLRTRRQAHSPAKFWGNGAIDIKHKELAASNLAQHNMEQILAENEQAQVNNLNGSGSGDSVQISHTQEQYDHLNLSREDFPPKKHYSYSEKIPSPVQSLIQDDELPKEDTAGDLKLQETSKRVEMTEPSMRDLISAGIDEDNSTIENSQNGSAAEYQDKDVPTLMIGSSVDNTYHHAGTESTPKSDDEEQQPKDRKSNAKPASKKRRKSACPKKRTLDDSDKSNRRLSDEEKMDQEIIKANEWHCNDPMLDDDEKIHMRPLVRTEKLSDEEVAGVKPISSKGICLKSPIAKRRKRKVGRGRSLYEQPSAMVSFKAETGRLPGEHWLTGADNLPNNKDREGIIMTARKSLPSLSEFDGLSLSSTLDGSKPQGKVEYNGMMLTEFETAKLIAAKETKQPVTKAMKKKYRKIGMLNTNSRFSCPHCGKRSTSHASAEKHLLTHKPKDQWPFECPLCLRTFQAKNDVFKHLRTRLHQDDNVPEEGTPDYEELILRACRFPWPPKEGQKNYTSPFRSPSLIHEENQMLKDSGIESSIATVSSENYASFNHHSFLGYSNTTQGSAKSTEDDNMMPLQQETITSDLELATSEQQLSQSYYSIDNPLGEGCSKDVMFPNT